MYNSKDFCATRESLKGAHVAIVGLGNTQGTFTSSVANGKNFDEVWAINSMMAPIKHDRVFMMDPASRFLDTENAGSQTEALRKTLGSHPGPIYTCILDERVPGAVLYPLEEVVKDTGLCYFNNTVPYAIAFAVYHKVTHLYLYGIDYSYKSNLVMAEAGRACTEFWLSAAVARGMKVEVAQDSSLLDTNVPDEEKLYGYHRLDDPLVMSVEDGALTVTKKSETTPPEPVDKPVLYGRHDKVVALKEAVNV
jgi:hypothetical protein